ncbi:bifunctional phosphoribosyl-AMP cyclohydrolase/phosphoribosyl-ATP diphosphatase HisIE [Terrisporobacter mayombei]|uniref:Histidine biosynthesis bifunctional protein HisIE n=1 Tax=Terrisporobacter mayombei TaxID=1541 RepID=A0ABY9PYN2_9FIRM|nr:bifunctional phosphoribosyl-AMP cyclohydrolase/phosphoribosyl-ATP diphosphatase HisIE [Terrisporobacter mayombei]MCC3868305.1 bifunctional phosphoribosyl-AMP cyclohydrolase/phosphoribosyl-ATP diphosphatase HisIE [Terrisporobacter mayombei]WMT80446.1 Histidine biosynthesis bifunctional protein HisIE [Terrisporobacter mayombei]
MRDSLIEKNIKKEIDLNLINALKFDEKGLIPVVVQDVDTKEVLMLAYMNKESMKKTLTDKKATYFSRSREELWTKGETSGNNQQVVGFYYDCDKDSILLMVKQKGVACHTGNHSCFFNEIFSDEEVLKSELIQRLYKLIKERKNNPKEGSYTNYLFDKGLDKILKKVGEESTEVIIGAKNENKDEIIYEISDLVYHIIVLMVNSNVTIEDIKDELQGREH